MMARTINDRAAGASESTNIQIGSRSNENFITTTSGLGSGLALALALHFTQHLFKRFGYR